MEFLSLRYVRADSIEKRDYQVNLAKQAIGENCIVVLPTGLGKTTVALQVIAEYMSRGRGGALFLAPTRVLVNQHYDFLRGAMTIQDIARVTGEDIVQKRAKLWNNSIVCATPEITRNDLERNIISPSQFSLVIFDEVHRAVGDYAYSRIAERFAPTDTRILGMTATLPSDREKATEIMVMLKVGSVAIRDEGSPDVAPYVQETRTEWVRVKLDEGMRIIQWNLRKALEQRCETLRRNGVGIPARPSLTDLLGSRQHVLKSNRRSATPLFTAIRIMYALSMLEVHGITTFLRFCERTRKKKGTGIAQLFEADQNFRRAMQLAVELQGKGTEHPKLDRLKKLLAGMPGKVLVFSSYRDSVDVIHDSLTEMGIPAGILIGKAGETGLKTGEQQEAVEKFRDGTYRVLVATRVGEEGLDISEVNHVIFYDNVPSSIRYVQRRGRTGRKDTGNLTVLMTEGTVDEAYYWIGKRKMASARGISRELSRSGAGGLDRYA